MHSVKGKCCGILEKNFCKAVKLLQEGMQWTAKVRFFFFFFLLDSFPRQFAKKILRENS